MARNRFGPTALAACLSVLAASTVARGAHAEDVVEHGVRPNAPLIALGFATFAVPYAISVGVAATSARGEDHALFAPLVGPWIDLATRGNCQVLAHFCNSETAARAALVVDGVFQGIGVILVASGIFWRESRAAGARQAGLDWVAPWASSSGGGLGAVGHF